MLDLLAENPLLLLFTVIGLGYLMGNINIFGFRLGVAAVLFTGIAFSAIDNRLSLPEHIYVIGLVLFVYAIGLQSGPGFFASFRKRGLRFSLIAGIVLLIGGGASLLIQKILHISAPGAAGLFCGALTNTPALAASVETAKNLSTNLPPETRELFVSSPVVTFGLTYPFGVFGVILWLYLSNKYFRKNSSEDISETSEETSKEAIFSQTFKITNPAISGKPVDDVLRPLKETGFVLSRIKKEDKIDIVASSTVLNLNDFVVAVGDRDAMERARLIFGEISHEYLEHGIGGINYRRIFVSNKAVVGKAIKELHLSKRMHAIITRLRRGDVDFIPNQDTILEMGDRIRVVTHRDNMDAVSKYFGDSIKSISETDYLSLSLGIVLGVFLGMIPIPLPNGLTFKLGFAGGPLIAGLILGRLGHTGKVIWDIPFNANLVLRQVGLVFFLAGIGTTAGTGLGAIFKTGGFGLIFGGVAVTTIVTIVTVAIAYKYLDLPMPAIMGLMSGIQTQPACLAYANQQADNDLPNVWYATVYPASMVAKIILAQIIVSTVILS